jgi:hypothetical protein
MGQFVTGDQQRNRPTLIRDAAERATATSSRDHHDLAAGGIGFHGSVRLHDVVEMEYPARRN